MGVRDFETDCEAWLKSEKANYENEEVIAADESETDEGDPLIREKPVRSEEINVMVAQQDIPTRVLI